MPLVPLLSVAVKAEYPAGPVTDIVTPLSGITPSDESLALGGQLLTGVPLGVQSP